MSKTSKNSRKCLREAYLATPQDIRKHRVPADLTEQKSKLLAKIKNKRANAVFK